MCGPAGCGKTILTTESLVRGAIEFDEPGVFMAFEETDKDRTNGTATILLVEDLLPLRKMIRIGLEKNGYTVIVAGDGVEALAVSKSYPGPIHLLVTDVTMPVMDGLRLAKRMAEQQPGIGVLYMSGSTDEMLDRQGAINSNMAFINKPFEMPDLLAKIREVLESDWRRR